MVRLRKKLRRRRSSWTTWRSRATNWTAARPRSRAALRGLEQQMHQSGLGLRGDIVASRANMRNDMAKAKQALDGMDTDRAQQFYRYG